MASKFYADATSNSRIFGFNSSEVVINVQHAISSTNEAREAASVQLSAETVTLFTIILLFLIGGFIAFVMMLRATKLLLGIYSAKEQPMITAVTTGASVLRRIRHTVSVVFLGFLFRAAFDVLYSIGLSSRRSEGCQQPCAACQSTYYLISKFLDYSPYVQTTVIFISEPLSLAVALFGMTTPRMWGIFKASFSSPKPDSYRVSL
jgi:hypothetical protein